MNPWLIVGVLLLAAGHCCAAQVEDLGVAVRAVVYGNSHGCLAKSPLGRAGLPDEVARTVVFLASEGTAFLTGAIVDVNGASYLRS